MIKVEHANKTFSGKYGKVHALQDVSIHVEKGDIYGIIGFSGAGKSTLIRLVNGLETLDSGTVTVHGEELGSLKKPQLRKLIYCRITIQEAVNIQSWIWNIKVTT